MPDVALVTCTCLLNHRPSVRDQRGARCAPHKPTPLCRITVPAQPRAVELTGRRYRSFFMTRYVFGTGNLPRSRVCRLSNLVGIRIACTQRPHSATVHLSRSVVTTVAFRSDVGTVATGQRVDVQDVIPGRRTGARRLHQGEIECGRQVRGCRYEVQYSKHSHNALRCSGHTKPPSFIELQYTPSRRASDALPSSKRMHEFPPPPRLSSDLASVLQPASVSDGTKQRVLVRVRSPQSGAQWSHHGQTVSVTAFES